MIEQIDYADLKKLLPVRVEINDKIVENDTGYGSYFLKKDYSLLGLSVQAGGLIENGQWDIAIYRLDNKEGKIQSIHPRFHTLGVVMQTLDIASKSIRSKLYDGKTTNGA